MKEKLLLAAAALLGFATACNNEEDQPKVVSMYGVPYNNYKIKGKVTDKAGRPIKGIEVRSNAYLPTPEATTAADGTYDLSGKGVGNTARVTLTDTDGPANGGDFAAKTVDIEFTEAERTAKGDGDWDQGAFAKSGVDIALEEKEKPLLPTSTSPGTEKRTPPMPKQVWHCARLSLYLQNIGCVSAMPKQVWHCALLSLYLPGGYTR